MTTVLTQENPLMQPKIYLAGPEVFLPNAVEHAEVQRQLCHKYGFIPLHPMDNNLDLGNKDYQTATRIYRGDVNQVRECDIVVANCNPFRSVSEMDPGTAYELGFGNGLGKMSYGYIKEMIDLVKRIIRDYPTTPWPTDPSIHIDKDGYLVTDVFGTSINLMMQCGMTESSGRLVEGDFEACLKAIRGDLDSGKLKL
jgi:nucleoside 2-deoxyribosyltransferase